MIAVQVVELLDAVPGARCFTTLEGHNPTRSIKDRLVEAEMERFKAKHGVEELVKRGICEVSAGSTARSLAHYCKALGIAFYAYIDPRHPEVRAQLEAAGATVCSLTGANMMEAYMNYYKEAAEKGYVRFDQLEDPTKVERYRSFGESVRKEVPEIHDIIGAIGTGHSLMGTALAFEGAKIHTAEARGFSVNGTRNLDAVWFGEQDPLHKDRPRLDRVLIDAGDMETKSTFASNKGTVSVQESFRLVLSAAKKIASGSGKNLLLVGAENRLEG